MSQDEAVGRLWSVPRSEDHVPGGEAVGAAAGGGEPQTVLARLGSHVPGGEPVLPLPVRRHLPVSLSQVFLLKRKANRCKRFIQ